MTAIHYLDHDADVGFEVHAPDLPSLWDGCARALIGVMTDPDAVREVTSVEVEIESVDHVAALVDSLAELLYRFEVDGLLLPRIDRVDVHATDEDVRLGFRASGEALDPARHPHETGIKAVTYHGAVVERTADGGWFARILVDL